MPFLHPNQPLAVTTIDGINFVSCEPLPARLRNGRLLRVRTGAPSDGLSSPKFIKCDLQTTNSFYPAYFHDGGYRGYIEESFDHGATWQPVQLTKAEADDALLELCLDKGEAPELAQAIYEAVNLGGQSAWDENAELRNQTR